MRECLTLALWALSVTLASGGEPADWSTFRGNAQRTGNTDGLAGPRQPVVQWVLKSQDHFVASLVPVGPNLYLSGLGAFNRPMVQLVSQTGTGTPKILWTRTAPYLRLASVSSPAISGNRLVFGDGMHQDAGGVLHCLSADQGRPIWQFPQPGELVHLEGAPTIAAGKVYMGVGAAGVVCVELNRAILDGKELTSDEINQLQDERWKKLQVQYEAAKKKDPDIAVPPSEDQLLKPAPKILWQVGQKRWHVDAPVCVSGDRVLVCTSYLDQEKTGERALHCLKATTGEVLWSRPLTLNPWGGASVQGDRVVVAGSSVGYYYNQLRGAKGELAAFDLTTGQPRWKKELPGGVVGCVALADGLAVCTATDGKVRAYHLADGDRRWIYDAKYPLFAPPAVVAKTVYVADLRGVIHAVGLSDGVGQWTLDLGTDPAVSAPGLVYGGVTVVGGKLFVATCNLEGPNARKPTCVVCLGSR